jgi:predicted metal-dependent enzyme (double-stranded beta helix superfamily)
VADSSHGAMRLGEAIDRITAIDWSRSQFAHREASRVLDALDADALLVELKADLEAIVDPARSSEKTTHYKWLVGDDPHGRFKLWLHEYKPKELRREGHAAIPHNHRFWLSSVILRGGFTDSRFRRVGRPYPQTDWIEPQASRPMSVGDTMTLAPEEIHALGDLRDGTVSLIVEGEAVRSFSEVFEGGTVRRYYDLEAKLADFRRSL